MKQEMRWGALAAVAIAAAVGISSRSTGRPQDNAPAMRLAQKATQSKTNQKTVQTQCSELKDLLQAFFLADNVALPGVCYQATDGPPASAADKSKDTGFQPKFIIATLPDPLHTHFSLLFDRFIEAIQQGAQDEGYEYDSSWLPWETEEPSFALLPDQDAEDDRTKAREDQPGILLFRKSVPKNHQGARAPYQEALIALIVGEEPTRGIHRTQFRNAAAWITALQASSGRPSVGILGPTFSGSFPSLSELISTDDVRKSLYGEPEISGDRLAIYSGSTTGKGDANQFAQTEGVFFHSFLQDDVTELNRFCKYLKRTTSVKETFDLHRLAILSEDETAYGYGDAQSAQESTCDGATWLYYPRDISTLRAAYQKQSMFDSVTAQQNQDAQRKTLPTDLADPAGKEHDTVRTYSGNQTPLSQEAELLGIVGALRSHRVQYVVLRGSNTLDPLFLANFLRREYPEARVVIVNADLLFQRGQDAMSLSGVMTLSAYPLFPWERAWTAHPPFSAGSHRVFPESSTEATYIASRLLLDSLMPGHGQPPKCAPSSDDVFVPSIRCSQGSSDVPIPDYAPPFWTVPPPDGDSDSRESYKPATWLSVITRSGSWPLAALNEHTLPTPKSSQGVWEPSLDWQSLVGENSHHGEWPPMPLSMKLLLFSLLMLSLFHAWCCKHASFTAKPAFRAHFATAGCRHRVLIFFGSFLIALMAVIAGWGCGVLALTGGFPTYVWRVRSFVFFVCVIAACSILWNASVTKRLNEEPANGTRDSVAHPSFKWKVIYFLMLFSVLIGLPFLTWVLPLERALILANQVLTYWRAMNLTSGVSPLVPFYSLALGLYIWFWYSLHGLALFGRDRPRLPRIADLRIKVKVKKANNQEKEEELDVLPMFSHEYVAEPAERAATPLATSTLLLVPLLFLVFWVLVALIAHEVPVRSLGARTYARIFCLWLDFCFSLIFSAGCQLWATWSRLRQLLVFLDRMPLRRTLGALRGFSWGSVWKMSGNVLDVRYKLLSRQLESLNHLHTSLQEFINAASDPNDDKVIAAKICQDGVEKNRAAVGVFAKWYSTAYRDSNAAVGPDRWDVQEQIAATTGLVLTHLLVPAWREEKQSLILIDPAGIDKDKGEPWQCPPPSTKEYIRNAEELVCLSYLGFAQNLLGRIRTITLGALCLFVAATLAVSSYPFDPRPALSGVLLLLFVALGTIVVFVYADMHRDATLSHVTNTNPGELGSEFWFKIIGFGAAPLLGLLTTVFPELSGSIFSWLQPGLNSLK
jgi:hypothetical protein